MIGAIVPQAQAAIASANIVKNILAGLVPSVAGLDALTVLSKDIGGFEFDYIGEERLEAATEITDHYTEDNLFIQDHRAVRPTILVARGFVAENVFTKSSVVGSILALSSALATVQPYIGQYAPGTAAKMAGAVDQVDQIVNQLTKITNIATSVQKLIGTSLGTVAQRSYNSLEAIRQREIAVAVVTPFKTFPSMLIENLIMVSPEDSRGWTDIVVRLKEIRVAPSLTATAQDNARGSQVQTNNGIQSAVLSGAQVA